MLQSRGISQLIRRARAKPRSSSRIVVVIASGLLAILLASCGQSGRASAPPIRDLAPVIDGAEAGELVVVDDAGERAVDEVVEISALNCRTTVDPELVQSDQEQQGPVQLVLDAVRVAQDDDERCGQRSTEEVYCRALWLLEVLDPAVIAFDPLVSPTERLEAAASLDWALTIAIEAPVAVSDPVGVAEGDNDLEGSVGNAFAQLRPLSATLAEVLEGVKASSRLTVEHEARLALLIRARAHPTILEPLSAMQTACLLGG